MKGRPAAGRAVPRRGLSVFVAFEDEYRSYRDVIAAAIRGHRPGAEVVVGEPGALRTVVPRLDPALVVHDGRGVEEPNGDRVWFELPADPTLPATIRIGASRTVCRNPGLRELLWAVDEAERYAASARAEAATPGAPTGHPC